MNNNRYFLKKGYKENLNNLYYDDKPSDNITWQPDVYKYAVEYAKKHNIKNIIDIGSGNGDKLYEYRDSFKITFIDFGLNLETIKTKYNKSKNKHIYLDQDFEKDFPKISNNIIKNSVVICSDVIEHVRDLNNLSQALLSYSKLARLLIISTPDRERLYGYNHDGYPLNPCHVREWTLNELNNYFFDIGMEVLTGLTRSNDKYSNRSTIFVVSGRDLFLNQKSLFKNNNNFQGKIINKYELENMFKQSNIKMPSFDDKFYGIYNPFKDNYMINHFISAISKGSTYSINKFKFINNETQASFAGSTNVDCAIFQHLKSTEGDYPIAFTLIYDGDTLSESIEKKLFTISAEHLAIHYMPEMIFGINLLDFNSDIAPQLPNCTNIEKEIESHTKIKRSGKLLFGNIKRKIINGKNN